jgi:hypothetical protein
MWGWVQTFTSYFDVYQGDFDPFTRVISDSCTRCHPRSMPKKLKMPPTGKAGCWGEEAIIITADMCVMCLYLSIFPSIHPSFHKEFTYRFTYSDIDLHKDLHMPIYPSIHPSLYIHLYISIYLSIYPSIYPSIYHLSIHLSSIYLNCSIPGFSISSHGLTAFASRARLTAQLHLTPVVEANLDNFRGTLAPSFSETYRYGYRYGYRLYGCRCRCHVYWLYLCFFTWAYPFFHDSHRSPSSDRVVGIPIMIQWQSPKYPLVI